MVEDAKKVVIDFISSIDVINDNTDNKIINVKEDDFLREVYLRMLKYMLPVDEKIKMLANAEEVALKEARRYKAFSVYDKSFGKSALLIYLADDRQRIERIFKALLQNEEFRSAVLKKKSIGEMKEKIDDFLSKDDFGLDDKKEERIKKEIEDLKKNGFPKPRHTALAALLFVRAIENPYSKAAVLDDEPYYICEEQTTAQPTPEKKTGGAGKVEVKSVVALAPKTENTEDFLIYYIDNIRRDRDYYDLVTKQTKKYDIRFIIEQQDLETCKKNILKIINSVLEWLGKKPLESESDINDKLLEEIRQEAEKKLAKKQSVLLPKKKPLLRVA